MLNLDIKIIDRNIISLCEQLNKNKKVDSYRKQQLRKLNNSRNMIIPMFAFLEGSKGRRENYLENKNTIKSEIKILKIFFKEAFVNEEFILKNIDELTKINLEVMNDDLVINEMIFIEKLHQVLYQPIKSEKLEDVKKDIFYIAKENNIKINSTLVICILSVLYGNNDIRKIFKFSNTKTVEEVKKLAYNSHNDVKSIVRLLQYISKLRENGRKNNVEYITFDKSLNILYNYLKNAKVENNIMDFEEYTNIEDNLKKFFPNFSEEKLEELKNELNLSSNVF